MLFIWPRLCQRQGDAQGGLVLPAGLQLAPRGTGVAVCIHAGKSQSGPGTSTRIPAAMGQPWGSPTAPAGGRLVENGMCPHCVPLGTRQQTLTVITSNLHIVKTVSLDKEREGK